MNDELINGNYGWPVHKCKCGGTPELITKGTGSSKTYAFECQRCGRRTRPRAQLVQAGEDWDTKRMRYEKKQPDLSSYWWTRY